jgi:head-tail adaptor
MAQGSVDPGRLNARLRLETPGGCAGRAGRCERRLDVGCRSLGSDRAACAPSRRRGGRGDLAPVSHRVTIRHRDDVRHAMRFVFRGRLLIRAVRDPDESRRYLICDCEEGAP